MRTRLIRFTATAVSTLALWGLVMLPAAFAQSTMKQLLDAAAGQQGAGYDTSANANTGLATLVGSLVRVALSFLGIIFVVLIIYAGFLWMTAAGNEEKVEKAKKIITQSVIGIVVVLSAWAIYIFVATVLNAAGGSGGGPNNTTG